MYKRGKQENVHCSQKRGGSLLSNAKLNERNLRHSRYLPTSSPHLPTPSLLRKRDGDHLHSDTTRDLSFTRNYCRFPSAPTSKHSKSSQSPRSPNRNSHQPSDSNHSPSDPSSSRSRDSLLSRLVDLLDVLLRQFDISDGQVSFESILLGGGGDDDGSFGSGPGDWKEEEGRAE